MNIFSAFGLVLVFAGVFSHQSFAQTTDQNTLLQIAQGDKLVLVKDLDIPANTDRLYFGLEMDSGYKKAGCALLIAPSVKSRRILKGSEIIFSGTSQPQKSKNEYGFLDYTYQAEVMKPSEVKGVECYGTSLQATYQDLYVEGMKQRLKESFEFVPAEPEIIESVDTRC